jgi:hypothetical protein
LVYQWLVLELSYRNIPKASIFFITDVFIGRNSLITHMIRNPLLFMNHKTSQRVVAYITGDNIVWWAYTRDDNPIPPVLKYSLHEFVMMMENSRFEADENTLFTLSGGWFVLINRNKYWDYDISMSHNL